MIVAVFILSFVAAFFEVTFLPTIKIAGGVIELGTIIVTTVMLFGSLRYSSIFLLLSAVFLSIFSQLPAVIFLLPNFLVLVILIFLRNRRVLGKPNTLVAFFIFFTAVVLVDLVKMTMLARFSLPVIYLILPDALYSAVIATTLFYIANRIYRYFNTQLEREEIKLLR